MRFRVIVLGFLASLASAAAFGQESESLIVATAREWGGEGGVYTCAQWRAYLSRLYRIADPRRHGYIEAADFERIKKISPVFRNASFDYFDVAGKGRVAQKEFVESESPFFAMFDKKHSCRVTQEDIRQATAQKPATPTPTQRPGGRGGGGGGFGGGGGGGGFAPR